MARTGNRISLGDGLYQDATGLSAIVAVGGGAKRRTREKRYPLGTDLKTIRDWQKVTRGALVKLNPERGTFAEDVQTYLAAKRSKASYDDIEYILGLWSDEFGKRARASIETVEIDTVLARWLTDDGLAPGTVYNRRATLQGLFTALNGKRAENPVDNALMPDLPDLLDRSQKYETIRLVLAAMPDRGRGEKGKTRSEINKTKLRAGVIGYTGLPHKLVKELTEEKFDREQRRIWVGKRRKGKGVVGRWIEVSDEGYDALVAFFDGGAAGTFSNSSMRHSWQRACKAAGVPYFRPYDLRHSFATATLEASGSGKATASLLMHSEKSQMMHRYTLGADAPLQRRAVSAFSALIGQGGAQKSGKALIRMAPEDGTKKAKTAKAS
jgi:integrase